MESSQEDSNNNTCEKKDTDKTTNGDLSKCEKILQSATISEDTSKRDTKEKGADLKDSKTKSDTASNDSGTKSSTVSNDSKTQTGLNRPALKSVPKPGAMSRPATGKSAAGGSRGAMAAFKQMDTANNPNATAAPKPKFGGSTKGGQPSVVEGLLRWCQAMTKEYQNVKIDNFSTSWNNGVAFLALIHHFYPDSFEWDKVDERRRRENFQLAFDLAEKKADIAPLLDVDDMVRMKKPDWKCVFTYVQSFYRKLRDHENNKHTYMQQ